MIDIIQESTYRISVEIAYDLAQTYKMFSFDKVQIEWWYVLHYFYRHHQGRLSDPY